MKIVYIHSTEPRNAYRVHVRCNSIMQTINRVPQFSATNLSLEEFIRRTPAAEAVCQDADLLVIHRYLYEPVIQALYYWKARDKKVIVDIDQGLNSLLLDHPDYHFWTKVSATAGSRQEISTLAQLQLGLRLVDAITVPTARLAKDFSPYGRTLVIPDALNTDEYLTPHIERPGVICLGLGGDEFYLPSLEACGLLKALEGVCSQRPQVRLLLAGTGRHSLNILPSITADRKNFIPQVSFAEWVGLLSTVDIGLAPIYGEYEQYWSNIRILEYMSMKIPWVASDLSPYRDMASYGWLVGNTAEAWERVLLEMVDHVEAYRAEVTGEPFYRALGLDMHENVRVYLDAYQSI